MRYQEIYDLVARIPPGRVTTYGQLALLLGHPRAARVVGTALGRCSRRDIPCHRVVSRAGGLSDCFSPMGKDSHRLLLAMEGVTFLENGNVDMEKHMWYGPETA